MRTGPRLALVALAALLLLLLLRAVFGTSAPRPGERLAEGRLVEADTIPDADAVGLCAVRRESGVVEGRIIGITSSPASDASRYRVQSLSNPAVEHVVAPVAIRIVSCDEVSPAGAATPPAPPGRTP